MTTKVHQMLLYRHTFGPMRTMNWFFVILLSLPVLPIVAQTEGERLASDPEALHVDSPVQAIPGRGDVQYTIPAPIKALLKDHNSRNHVRQGFRVQIFLGDRNTAETTKRSFLQKYPDTPAYLSWLAPNFRLRVGDLPTRLEAEHLLRELRTAYPGSYIVPDDIGAAR